VFKKISDATRLLRGKLGNSRIGISFLVSLSSISFLVSLFRLTNQNKGRLSRYQKELLVTQDSLQRAKKFSYTDIQGGNEAELNIFQYWHQGFDRAPELIKACLRSVENSSGEYNYILLDENTLVSYLELPKHVYKALESGRISLAGFSDIVRSGLLSKYGGVWIDATCLITDPSFIKLIEKEQFFAFQSSTAIFKNNSLDTGNHEFSSWFLRARKHSATMLFVYESLCSQILNSDSFPHYYFFHFLMTAARAHNKSCEKEMSGMLFKNNIDPHILQQKINESFCANEYTEILRLSSVHKLAHQKELTLLEDSMTYGEYIERNF
jgi:hypothetical protein